MHIAQIFLSCSSNMDTYLLLTGSCEAIWVDGSWQRHILLAPPAGWRRRHNVWMYHYLSQSQCDRKTAVGGDGCSRRPAMPTLGMVRVSRS